MYLISQRRVRLTVLAVATAAAVSAVGASSALAANNKLRGSEQVQVEEIDQFIVRYRDGSAERADANALQASLSRAAKLVPASGGRAFGLKKMRRLGAASEVVRADRKLNRAEAVALMRQIAADPNVEIVEIDKLNKALVTPNDTRYNEQWHYFQSTGGLNLPNAWDRSTGSGVVVAVLDTGITSHTELNANVLPGYDFVSNSTVGGDGNGRDSNPADPGDFYDGDPSSWHGTHVAGTVAAVTNNAAGVAGVAYGAKILPVRVLGRGGGYDSDIIDAITWASGGTVSGVPANANPAEVINLSLGGPGSCSSSMQTAINNAVARGTTLVIAAGNSNQDVSGYSPAGCNNVIAVAASDNKGNRSWFSNYGAKIDVTAPGGETWHCSNMPGEFWPLAFTVQTAAQCGSAISHDAEGILSTWNAGSTTVGSQTYGFMAGTSMAAPHVAGVVALMQAAAATPLTPAQVEATLKSTVRTIAAANCPGGCGAGFVNVDAAVAAAAGGGGGTPTPTTQTYTNGTDITIPDNNATGVTSTINVSGRTGNAPSNAVVAVNIVHTYKGDLIVDLLAPDGSIYTLHNRTGSSTDNINTSYTVNLSSEALNGAWRLRARDRAAADTGYINSWSITF